MSCVAVLIGSVIQARVFKVVSRVSPYVLVFYDVPEQHSLRFNRCPTPGPLGRRVVIGKVV